MSKNEVELQVTDFAAAKSKIQEQKDGELVKLPSGMVFRLTRPTVSSLIRSDAIPSELIAAAMSLDAQKIEPRSKEDYVRTMKVIDEVVFRATVEPKLRRGSDAETEDTISIDDLLDDDRIAIYLFAQTGVKPELNSFREEHNSSNDRPSVPEVPGAKTE